MKSVEIMVMEHDYILRMLNVMRKACINAMNGENINYDDFSKIIEFIRKYADAHHHGKEEKFLFKEMQINLGKLGENLITHGMLVEHDYGRLYVSNLEDALHKLKKGDDESKLDVISNAVAYTNLLKRHIAKENEAVYMFGEKNLPKEVIDKINEKTDKFEREAEKMGTQKYFIDILESLEKKYI
ncbi:MULTISPECIES: hemerythrin domain-containing protein [unclassified Sedimentibacter]|uniref:hemerythrin domain-containing protein n=1 Tax=unclassified Sedimentibacter TaxID=2649220 RepID=UPI001BD4E830|nr:hemerythrin domain-containing protein [Sedimentibacter sp. MB35-C1]WMJ77391.1 hemerythrin domain-containing protein [Sedimentibacter sp. MB35-C1]